MKKDELLQTAIKEISLYMKREKPYLFKIDDLVTITKNGTINISLRVYNGFVTDIVVSDNRRITFDKPK